ncbi:MAG: histidine phosphatase family protein [Proteobacteria bacterium]|nr:histidine phosphatase family protein [Pseudomonadota bacterium]
MVRHGETAWNLEGRVQGHADIPLNPKGCAQALAIARGLENESFAAIYSSDLQRALQTAEPIASRHGLSIHGDPALRERHFGVLQALTKEEARLRHPEAARRHGSRDPDYAYDDGESLVAFEQRIRKWMDALARRHVGGSVLVVTHGGVLDVAYRYATGMALTQPRNFALPNAALNWLEADTDGWRLLLWADSAHLEQALDETS